MKGCEAADYVDPESAADGFKAGIVQAVLALLPSAATREEVQGDLAQAIARLQTWVASRDVPLGYGEIGPPVNYDDVALVLGALAQAKEAGE